MKRNTFPTVRASLVPIRPIPATAGVCDPGHEIRRRGWLAKVHGARTRGSTSSPSKLQHTGGRSSKRRHGQYEQ